MAVVYKERIENPDEIVLIRIPKELQGTPLEVTLAPTEKISPVVVDLEWDAEYRRAHEVHPSWSPEDLALLHAVAGSMPDLEELVYDPDEPDEEHLWRPQN